MSELHKIKRVIQQQANKKRALVSARFFKTGPGQYGEGDIFIGLSLPLSRIIAKEFSNLSLEDIKKLLASKIHEERMIALIILVNQFQKATPKQQKIIFDFYLKQTKYINNWDLVDVSADKIVGEHLYGKPVALLEKLTKSKNLWERRIAVVATFAFIKKGEYKETFTIAKQLLNDQHDLIHKAVGWMLREVGKRSSFIPLRNFLDNHGSAMPRTMLRYAIEHLPAKERKKYLNK